MLQNGGESGVTAVVGPVGVENAQLGLGGVAALVAEVVHHLSEVVGIHRQPPLLAERCQVGLGHIGESVERGERLYVGVLNLLQLRQVFLPCLHGVDVVMANASQVGIANRIVEQQQAGTANLDIRLRVNQMDAIHGRRGALVELSGNELDGQIALSRKVAAVGYGVGYPLAKNAVAALLQQLGGETEQVVDAEVTQLLEMELQVLVEFLTQALCLDAERFFLFDKDTIVSHSW